MSANRIVSRMLMFFMSKFFSCPVLVRSSQAKICIIVEIHITIALRCAYYRIRMLLASSLVRGRTNTKLTSCGAKDSLQCGVQMWMRLTAVRGVQVSKSKVI